MRTKQKEWTDGETTIVWFRSSHDGSIRLLITDANNRENVYCDPAVARQIWNCVVNRKAKADEDVAWLIRWIRRNTDLPFKCRIL